MSLYQRDIDGKIVEKPVTIDFLRQFTKVEFKKLFPIVEASFEDNRRWMIDFQHDEIFVPNDLSDVISAYEHFYGQFGNS